LVFKNDIVYKLEERIDLYRLFDDIEDKDLREIGAEFISSTRGKLEELSRGLLIGQSSELVGFLGEKVANAKQVVRATLVVESPESLQRWMNPPASNYYEINKRVVKSGKKFQRIFILSRARFFKEGYLNQDLVQVVRQQQDDGLDIYVVWEEDLGDLAFREDFVIVDHELVHINDTGAVTLGGWRTRISKNQMVIKDYVKKFDLLLTYTHRAEQVIGRHVKPENDSPIANRSK
jgi:hypothetical protein